MTVSDLKKYKDSLYTSLCRDISEFEKNFLFIAGGILAFSITFIKDIITLNEAIWVILLFTSWLMIIVAIAIMMYSFLRSANASDDLWKIVDDFVVSNDLYDETENLTIEKAREVKSKINAIFFPKKISLKKQRGAAVFSFILGISLLTIFVSLNIIEEKSNSKKQKSNKKTHVIVNDIEVFFNDSTLIIKTK